MRDIVQSPLRLTESLVRSPNICAEFDAADLKSIGDACAAGLAADEMSRSNWMRRNEAGMDLALQASKVKNFPWPGSSNVNFPLVTIAALQFHARAYPAILNSNDVVKCKVNGRDETGAKTARAWRVSTHMSWQVTEEDTSWEEQEDKTLLNQAIVGTAFKKSYRSGGKNTSDLVMAKDLVLDYWAKSVEACPRKTHLIPFSRNDIYERVQRGTFCDILEEAWYKAAPAVTRSEASTRQDERQGTQPPQADWTTSFRFGEQHVDMDLDGDGYAERWIITFDVVSHCVVRIVAGFDWQDIEWVAIGSSHAQKVAKINPPEYFTKRTFIPNPDGGIYDIGFGVFLGPLNESVNTLINQLIDAGTMQTTSGGFLGRGAKIRGGTYTFAPFEWKRVDSSGDDLRKNVVPLQINEPSSVLFNLLSLLIDYTNRIAGSTDIMVGENPGQNTPAQTTQTMVEQGAKIYTAIFKRVWRSLGEEFKKLYLLNQRFLKPGEHVGGVTVDDYRESPDDISPAADPNVTSEVMRLQQAMTLKQAAASTPGYNHDAVEMRFLKAMNVDAPEQLFPGTQGTPPPEDPKLTIEKMKLQFKQTELQFEQQKFIAQLQEDRRMNDAQIFELQAKAQQEAALAQTEAQYAQVAAINAQISLSEARSKHINTQIDHMLRVMEIASNHTIEMKKASLKAVA